MELWSRPIPGGAAFTRTSQVTIVISFSMAPKPSRSPNYRCMFAASTGAATRAPPRTLAASPTTPLCCLVKVVKMSASLYSCVCVPRASRFSLPRFAFLRASCHMVRLRSTSPSGSRECADPIPIRDSTGANVCLATRGRRVSPRHASDGHYFSPSMCVCSRTHGLVTSPFLQFFFGAWKSAGCFVCCTATVSIPST